MKDLRVDTVWNGNYYSSYDLKIGCSVEPKIGRIPEISRQSSMLAVTGCDSHQLNQPL